MYQDIPLCYIHYKSANYATHMINTVVYQRVLSMPPENFTPEVGSLFYEINCSNTYQSI